MTETDMSSTTKTEIIVEMKSGKTDKENNVGEGRILRPKRVNYIINEKKISKKDSQIMQRGTITDKVGEEE